MPFLDSPLESVWDYPRPPRLESSSKHIRVVFCGVTLAETQRAYRVLETSHPPVYYIPPDDIDLSWCQLSEHQTFCEWKGSARYYSIQRGDAQGPSDAIRIARNAAWFYPSPTEVFQPIQNYVAFYPSLMDACWVDEEKVQAQIGDFYGGWITKDIVGPFKGAVGTWGW